MTARGRINWYPTTARLLFTATTTECCCRSRPGTSYFYSRNAQGDIIGVYRVSDSKLIGTYEYDLWGRPISVKEATVGIDTDGILTKNPFRYRGYYYDRETGFYATGARYYDPQIERFISADNLIASVGSSIQGHNLFAYCFSNPVNMSDSTGQWPRELTLGVGIAALTIGALAPEVIVGAMVVAAVCGIVFGIQSLHYDAREVLNEGVPEKESEATQPDWIGPPNSPSAACHQFSAPSKAKENVKYVSKDGHKEVIYDYNGLKVTDSRDIGTYNFCPSGTMWGDAGHVCVDILPWVIFGNNDSDPGPGINIINSWLN